MQSENSTEPAIGRAVEPESANRKATAADIESVEMFRAIEEGKIEVNFYPKDAT